MAAPTPDPKIGERFGMLEVISGCIRFKDSRFRHFKVRCDCGITKILPKGNLIRKSTKSCGCIFRKAVGDANRTHGKTGSAVYTSWVDMKRRCYSQTHKSYVDYGERGIKVCEAWQTFENFYADMGDPPFKGATLERKDNDGNYCKDNVVWATRHEQANNNRRSVRFRYKEQEFTLKELADKFKINCATLKTRLYRRGMTVEEAVTLPVMTPQQVGGKSWSRPMTGSGRTVGHKLYGGETPQPKVQPQSKYQIINMD